MKLSDLIMDDIFVFKGESASSVFMYKEKFCNKVYYTYRSGLAICEIDINKEVELIDSPRSKKWYNILIKKLWR